MAAQAPPEIDTWRASGRELDVFGHRVFVRLEGTGSGTPVLYLHGFPTCSFDLRHAIAELAPGRRVVVHDHVGFGLSSKPAAFSYSLFEQADIALGVWKALGIEEGHLVSHDYGTSVANELVARAVSGQLPFKIRSATFCNGSMLIELAKLRVTQQLLRSRWLGPTFARLASYRVFRAQMRRIFGKPDAIGGRELELAWWLMQHEEGWRRMPAISGYIDERFRFRARWGDALERMKGAGIPAHVLWGDRDPICVPELAKEIARLSGGKLEWLPGLGHYPMLEDPGAWGRAVAAFIQASEMEAGSAR